ncbi:hypothetical protein BDV24DRAFT_128148 [Aspergillus arachidicola]|uniref:Uncharacterized protein n=1 Tax=Aspergillus arachidicola TaxID=656916 RepID=A0A5N6YF28_9EURO|nr:hypothetical protein BDV24DRAFT_128148 [Aspergillus arachidicola]
MFSTMDRRIVYGETHKTLPFLMLFFAASVSAIVAASNGWRGRPLALLKTIVLSIGYQWWKICARDKSFLSQLGLRPSLTG